MIYSVSCGPDMDPYDYYISFFNPATKGQGYEPFYYTALSRFYGDITPTEESVNVSEWQRYAGSKITAPDIREYIYTYKFDQMQAVALDNNAVLPDSVKRNSFAQYLLKDKEAARYLVFAKTCEPSVSNSDPWDKAKGESFTLSSLLEDAKAGLAETKNKDIRDRYAFQLVRLQHYNTDYRDAVASFDELFTRPASSLIYYKALALKAGALQHLRDTVQSAYLFSRVFDKAPSIRFSSYLSLTWSGAKEQDVYKLCKDDREKAMVAAIYGFAPMKPDLSPLKKVYNFDPSSPALEVLLTREVNKLEDMIFNYEFGVPSDSIVVKSLTAGQSAALNNAVKPLENWLDEVLAKRGLKNEDLFRVSSAYLAYLRRDYTTARAKLDKDKIKDPVIKDQWEIVNLLVNINQQKTIDAAFEEKLLASFKWLDGKLNKRKDNEWDYHGTKYFFDKTYRNLLGSILAPRYHMQGDLVKEALVRGRIDSLKMYDYFLSGITARELVKDDMNSGELLKLYNFLKQPSKTSYESYLTGFFPKELNMPNIIGVSYLRVHDFKNAQEWFRKTNKQSVSYQVFQDQLQDFGEDTADQYHKKPINQLQFCDRMLALQEKMKATPVDAKMYYEYATALFNISYYGRSWPFLKDYRPSTSWYRTEHEKDPFTKQYFGCYEAESYYLKAAQAATDQELRARCFFMAARCSQKHTSNFLNSTAYYTALVRNRYFPVFMKNYGQTKFYKQVYGQCSYLRDYVRSTRR
ncbi:MAG TPA: hypothetical protein VM802_21375 [Chitinophaga sp.]|uniref:hypothetical protein n=1 Tax=Chitinophaga sp. TaxID=1869181 RepID=UPI002C653244|nr:hypothetical protein [Chitinophaga sp.]HVI47438.1 hypothetical protein [Chitinophaga sp.]